MELDQEGKYLYIYESVYEELVFNTISVPPETGGIIGTYGDCRVVSKIYRDISASRNSGFYEPDIKSLNRIIKEWDDRNICFVGLFHTHAEAWDSLSLEDERYIYRLLDNAIEDEILYFPLVFPKKGMLGYIAYRHEDNKIIKRCEVKVVEDLNEK